MGENSQKTKSTNPFPLPRPNPGLYTTQDHKIYSGESPPLHSGPNDCIVHVRANGICGSDLHFWHAGGIGPDRVTRPYILGHEGSGVIHSIGPSVTQLKPGDRVAIEPGQPCHSFTCAPCSSGSYNLCPTVRFSGCPPHDGSIRRYHVHDSRYLHKLPKELSFSDGALLEPLSVVLHAFERAPVRLGEPLLVCGAGPIGLIAAAAGRASGAFPIVVVDVDERRLEFASGFVPGAETVLLPPKGGTPEGNAEVIKKRFLEVGGEEQPRVVMECSGVHSSVVTAALVARRGGTVMVVGVGREVMDGLPFMHLSLGEIDVKFINRYHHSWPYAIRLMQSGLINLRPLITHKFKLEDAVQALETALDRTKNSIKIHILDDEEEE